MSPLYFDIKRYAINDGPGIRTTVFMKGCPLSCVWCHNPEGISLHQQKMYTKKRCIGCNSCIVACPNKALCLGESGIVTDSFLCVNCGKCVEECPSLAMEMSGKIYSVDELMEELNKETLFMDQSGGGVTFCGGEPLLHVDTLLTLLCRCGELGIHRAVDTSLHVKPEVLKKVIPYTDLFLIDLKHMDSVKHKQYCGVPNELILSNIQLVAASGIPFHIRIPLVEGVNADDENIIESASFLSRLPWQEKRVHLLLYHDIGKGKHEKLSTVYNPEQYNLQTPSEITQQRCCTIFENYGINTILGG